MISETAPVAHTHHQGETMTSAIKDNAFVSLYNDTDISEYLFKQPAFSQGFLPLEPEPEQPKQTRTVPIEATNTATTPPPTKTATASTPLKSAMKSSKPAKVVERRPSFIEVSVPHHHEHEHQNRQRRHSSESHLPMSWWPDTETVAEHVWVERDQVVFVEEDQVSADEEEDAIEEAFYASYD